MTGSCCPGCRTYGFSLVRDLLDRLPSIDCEQDLRRLIADVAAEMAFRWFALIDHVDQAALRTGEVGIYAYPDPAAERLLEYRELRRDTVIRGCHHATGPFLWSRMREFMQFSADDDAAMAFGRRLGIGEGITVPVIGGRKRMASLTFTGSRRGDGTERFMGALQMMAPFILQCARRIAGFNEVLAPPPRLTPRQLDCAILAGRGLQNKEIAFHMGVSTDHVAQLLTLAMRRLGVRNRAALAIAAVAAAEFEFREVDPQSP